MKNLLARIIGGVGILALMIMVTYLGGPYLFAALLVISSLATYELLKVFKILGYKNSYLWSIVLNALVMIAAFQKNLLWHHALISILVMLSLATVTFNDRIHINDCMSSIFVLLYISVFFSYFLYLDGTPYIWLIFIASWGTDTFAYVFGMLFGRHRLYEKISPKKSVEGAIGGTLGALALAYIFAQILKLKNTMLIMSIILIASIMSQIGDLCASYFKRKAGVKDYGKLIKGHGGILDRFDSMLFACPVVYYLLKILIL